MRRIVSGVAGLFLKLLPVDGATVEAWWRAGLVAELTQAEALERFAEQDRGGFAGTAGGVLLLAAVDEAVEEGAGGDDGGGGVDAAAVAEDEAANTGLRAQATGLRAGRLLIPDP
jgi:hypothetical protein